MVVSTLLSARLLDGEGGAEPAAVHVHALGVNPADGALFVATHTGLFRLGRGDRRAERVGDSRQDTMGFTVVGPDRFLGSGHPDLRDDLPPLLGLVESRDAGRTWTPVSLLGEADFHALRARGQHVVGYDATGGRVLASDDAGMTWRELEAPEPLLDLAVDPASARRLVATGARGVWGSADGGGTWRRLSRLTGLLTWPGAGRLYALDSSGRVWLSRDGGGRWQARGRIGGAPAALFGLGGPLYAARHDGTIVHSVDGGSTWTVRSRPDGGGS